MAESIPMMAAALGFVLTAALFVRIGGRGGVHAADLGAVSHQWVAAYRAGEPASSI